jgi:hypothetical protein
MRTIILTCGLLLAAHSAGAAELLVTTDAAGAKRSGGSHTVALDLASDGAVSAVDFRISLGKGVRSIDTSACLADLPATHTGMCEANPKNGRVAIVVWSLDNKPLPQGVVGFGQLKVQYQGSQASTDEIQVDRTSASAVSGSPVSLSARVEREAASRQRVGRTTSER